MLAVEERTFPQVLAIVLNQVEGVEDRSSSSSPSTQLLESRQAIRPHHNRLAIDREAFRLDPLRSGCDRR